MAGRGIDSIGKDLKPRYTMVVSNDSDHAKALHFDPRFAGKFPVVDREHLVKGLVDAFKESLEVHIISDQVVVNSLKAAGVREISFYRSFGSEMRPPATAGGGERQAHPLGWADISKDLAKSYKLSVNDESVEIEPY